MTTGISVTIALVVTKWGLEINRPPSSPRFIANAQIELLLRTTNGYRKLPYVLMNVKTTMMATAFPIRGRYIPKKCR